MFLRQHFRKISTLKNYECSTFLPSSPSKNVLHLEINRSNKKNSIDLEFWENIRKVMNTANSDVEVRAIILSAKTDPERPVFSAGVDLAGLSQKLMDQFESEDPARRMLRVRELVLDFQDCLSATENCRKPVIAAVHGACIGGGIDMISAADIRYCTDSSWFSVKEVDVGLAADVGTLQRMQKCIGNQSIFRELCLTARKFNAEEAEKMGFVSSIAKSEAELMDHVKLVAKTIAEKSPLATQSTKVAINYSRDHSVREGLEMQAIWNGCALTSEDLVKSAVGFMQKKGPEDIDYENC